MAQVLAKRALSSSCNSLQVRIPARERVVTYGKYKGQKLGDLPDQYLRPMLKKLLWAESVKEVLDERLPKYGVSRSPLIFTVGKRSPVKAKLVTFDFTQCQEEVEEFVRIRRGRRIFSKRYLTFDPQMPTTGILESGEKTEELGITEGATQPQNVAERLPEARESDRVDQQHLPRTGILESMKETLEIRDESFYAALENGDVDSSTDSSNVDTLKDEILRSAAASDDFLHDFQQMPFEGITESGNDDVISDSEVDEESNDEDRAVIALDKQYSESRRSEIRDRLMRMREENRAFTLRMMEDLVEDLESEKIKLDADTNAYLVHCCSELGDLEVGEKIHVHLMKTGQSLDKQFKFLLMEMYGKCGDLETARDFFDKLREKNEHCFGVMVSAYAQHGQSEEALNMLCEGVSLGLVPNLTTLVAGVHACTSLKALHRGREICEVAADLRLCSNDLLGTALVEMYASCGSVDESRVAFSNIRRKTVDCYNAMLCALTCSSECFPEVMKLYRVMDLEGVKPNESTYAILIQACGHSSDFFKYGKQIHQRVLEVREECGSTVLNALVHMYGKCKDAKSAWTLYKSMDHKDCSWSALIESWK